MWTGTTTTATGPIPWRIIPVTSFYVSGPVRFPVGLRLYRRYEELTQWEDSVAKHFPDLTIPTEKKARNRLHKQVDPVLLQDPEFRARHEQFRTKIALAIELVEEAIRQQSALWRGGLRCLVPGGGLGPGLGPAAEGLDQLAQKEPPAGNGQLSAAGCQRLAAEAAKPPHRGRGAGAADPGQCVSPRQGRRADVLVLHAGGPRPRPGQGADRGEL